MQPLPATYDHGGGQLPYQTTPYYQPRAAFEIAPPSFPSFISRKNPAVTSFYPKRGPQGTHFYVYLESEHDLLAPTRLNIYLLFASRRCQSILTRLESQSANYVWVITADVPSFSLTGWRSPEVPLQLELQEESGLAVGTVDVGTFTYSDYQQLQTPSPAFPRKRKLSIDTTEMMQLGAKRPATEQLLSREAQDFVSDLYSHNQSSAYPHYSRSFTPNSLPSTYSSYDAVQKGVRKRSSTFSGGMNRSQSHVRAASHHAPGWSSAYAGGLHSGRSPALSATPASRVSSVPSPSMSANPPLIRTSTLQQNSGTAPGPSSISSSGSFNPYALYPHKAVLKINGDLDSMADHWTPDEWAMKRRIVQFWRSQAGSTITTNFEPVSPDNRPPNSICISCIWWEERQECFVTSVDTIYLLESLVAVRFTVEEKNRIRRNLEGFRPMTVSKAKSDSEDFFRIIMGFPNPKPRNIEKDVKVFPWKILAHALKKIFGKYVSHITSVHTFLPPPKKGMRLTMSICLNSLRATLRLLALCAHRGRTSTVLRASRIHRLRTVTIIRTHPPTRQGALVATAVIIWPRPLCRQPTCHKANGSGTTLMQLIWMMQCLLRRSLRVALHSHPRRHCYSTPTRHPRSSRQMLLHRCLFIRHAAPGIFRPSWSLVLRPRGSRAVLSHQQTTQTAYSPQPQHRALRDSKLRPDDERGRCCVVIRYCKVEEGVGSASSPECVI